MFAPGGLRLLRGIECLPRGRLCLIGRLAGACRHRHRVLCGFTRRVSRLHGLLGLPDEFGVGRPSGLLGCLTSGRLRLLRDLHGAVRDFAGASCGVGRGLGGEFRFLRLLLGAGRGRLQRRLKALGGLLGAPGDGSGIARGFRRGRCGLVRRGGGLRRFAHVLGQLVGLLLFASVDLLGSIERLLRQGVSGARRLPQFVCDILSGLRRFAGVGTSAPRGLQGLAGSVANLLDRFARGPRGLFGLFDGLPQFGGLPAGALGRGVRGIACTLGHLSDGPQPGLNLAGLAGPDRDQLLRPGGGIVRGGLSGLRRLPSIRCDGVRVLRGLPRGVGDFPGGFERPPRRGFLGLRRCAGRLFRGGLSLAGGLLCAVSDGLGVIGCRVGGTGGADRVLNRLMHLIEICFAGLRAGLPGGGSGALGGFQRLLRDLLRGARRLFGRGLRLLGGFPGGGGLPQRLLGRLSVVFPQFLCFVRRIARRGLRLLGGFLGRGGFPQRLLDRLSVVFPQFLCFVRRLARRRLHLFGHPLRRFDLTQGVEHLLRLGGARPGQSRRRFLRDTVRALSSFLCFGCSLLGLLRCPGCELHGFGRLAEFAGLLRGDALDASGSVGCLLGGHACVTGGVPGFLGGGSRGAGRLAYGVLSAFGDLARGLRLVYGIGHFAGQVRRRVGLLFLNLLCAGEGLAGNLPRVLDSLFRAGGELFRGVRGFASGGLGGLGSFLGGRCDLEGFNGLGWGGGGRSRALLRASSGRG